MNRSGRRWAALVPLVPLSVVLTACGDDAESIGTSSLTIELSNLVAAQGSQLHAELVKQNVDYLEGTPAWDFLQTAVDSSPFSASDTVAQLPAGEFSLLVVEGPPRGGAEDLAQKGQGCEMTVTLAEGEAVTVSIDGLNAFVDKRYGECNATITR